MLNTNSSKYNCNMETNQPTIDLLFQDRDEDEFDLIEFGIATNGGRTRHDGTHPVSLNPNTIHPSPIFSFLQYIEREKLLINNHNNYIIIIDKLAHDMMNLFICLPSLPSWIVYLPSLPSWISWPYALSFGAIYRHGLMCSAGRCNEAHSRIPAWWYLLGCRNF